MITIVAKSIIKEDKKEEYLDLVKELISESRKEKGCISYSLYGEIKNPNVLTFIEEWENEEYIDSHNSSLHYTTIVPKLRKLREGDAEVNIYRKLY